MKIKKFISDHGVNIALFAGTVLASLSGAYVAASVFQKDTLHEATLWTLNQVRQCEGGEEIYKTVLENLIES